MTKRKGTARLKVECSSNCFMLMRVTDIDSGISIPIKSISIKAGIENAERELTAIIEVPIYALDLAEVKAIVEVEGTEEDE